MTEENGGRRRILVVEDEPAISEICVRALSDPGFEVDIASNGKLALGMLRGNQYDLCLIDVRTPEMDGIELYEWLKHQRPDLVGKVVFTTGDVMSGNISAFLDATGRPYLPKPFTPDELRAAVRTALAAG